MQTANMAQYHQRPPEFGQVILDSYILHRGEDRETYLAHKDRPHIVRPLRDADLVAELKTHYYQVADGMPTKRDTGAALEMLDGSAQQLPREATFLRRARWEDRIYVDLGRDDGRVVEVRPQLGDWVVVDTCPVLFRRTKLTDEMPIPTTGGNPFELGEVLALGSTELLLVVGWMVAALIPGFPHPILYLNGPQGSSKSTTMRRIRAIVDPAPPVSMPDAKRRLDFGSMASNTLTLAMDNVTKVDVDTSEVLCRTVDGDGFVTRALYTNNDVFVRTYHNLVVMTSIGIKGLASDLLDRMLPVEFERISQGRRELASTLDARFEEMRAEVLGGILGLVGLYLEHEADPAPPNLPRMADYAKVLHVLETHSGEQYWTEYMRRANRTTTVTLTSPVVDEVLKLMRHDDFVEMTPSILYDALTPRKRPLLWPANPAAFSKELFSRQVQDLLEQRGIRVEKGRNSDAKGSRKIAITNLSATSPSNTGEKASRYLGDDQWEKDCFNYILN